MERTKKSIVIFACLLCHTPFFAQTDENLNAYMEEMESFQEEDGSQFEVENLIDLLNELKETKLDLNHVSEEELDQLPFLNDREARELVLHRELYGPYQTLYELKNIPGLEMEKVQQLLAFVTIRAEERQLSFKEMLRQGQSQIYLSTDRYIQRKSGYEADSNGTTQYAGSPFHYYAKYLFNAERIKASLVGEKDAGEAEWSATSKGFDFFSGSIAYEGKKILRQLCMGDYKANFGQGLVVGTGSILGKNASITNSYKNSQGLKRYASTGEADFFRGMGATLGWRALRLTLFGSIKKGDATLTGEDISSFKTDGMHRTTLEIEKKRNYREDVVGGNLSFKRRNLTLGYTLLYYHYSSLLNPSTKGYTKFRLSETQSHWNMGLDYKLRLHHFTLFGECALDANGYPALMNGASIFPLSRLEITLAQRYYHPGYQSNYGKGFSENSRIENEEGFYLTTRFSPFKRVILAAYVDCFRFPWLLYATDMPSSGQEFCFQSFIKISGNVDETIKFKYKRKDDEGGAKQTLRSTLNAKIKRWRLQTILEGNRALSAEGQSTYGWIVSQSATGEIRPLHLSLSLRHAYFQAKNYNNRIYIYEKDLPYTLSFPMHYGEGHRIAMSLMWRYKERLQLHAKAGWFIYTDGRETMGTGNEMMQGNCATQVKMMVKVVI